MQSKTDFLSIVTLMVTERCTNLGHGLPTEKFARRRLFLVDRLRRRQFLRRIIQVSRVSRHVQKAPDLKSNKMIHVIHVLDVHGQRWQVVNIDGARKRVSILNI